MKVKVLLTVFLVLSAGLLAAANQSVEQPNQLRIESRQKLSAQITENYQRAKENIQNRFDYYLDELIFDYFRLLRPTQLVLIAEFSKMTAQSPYALGYYLNRNHSVVGRLEYTSRKVRELLAYDYFYRTASNVIANEDASSLFYVISKYHPEPAVLIDAGEIYRVMEQFGVRLRQLQSSCLARLKMLEDDYLRQQKQLGSAIGTTTKVEPSGRGGIEAISFGGRGKSFVMIDGQILYAGDKINGKTIEAVSRFGVKFKEGFKSYTESIDSSDDFGNDY